MATTLKEMIDSDLGKTISLLTADTKDIAEIDKYVAEYEELDRTIRDTQVGTVQKDKVIGTGEKSKTVKAIKIPVSFQKKIVSTSCAFEFGAPVTLVPSEQNELFVELKRLWKENRVDDKLQQAKLIQKTQTQCALHFFLKDVDATLKATTDNGAVKKQIKVNVLSHKEGKMSPYFDSTGDMIAFVWEYASKDVEGKTINNVWIFDSTSVYKCDSSAGDMTLLSSELHGFDRIPVVYMYQDYPEWHDVQSLIDRFEVSLSKLGASNDYSGYPLLKTYGDVSSLPDRNDDGKTINFPMKIDEDSGKEVHGDAEFLTNDNAPESVKLEMEKIEQLIYSLSYTPNLSFENMKSIGTLSGVALKLMFLDSIIKSKLNEGENRTIVERIINIFIGGTITSTMIKLKGKPLTVDVKFNSILPNDTVEAVNIVTGAIGAGAMSKKTAVEYIGINNDTEAELALIEADKAGVQPTV
ncbi:MAG: phage portal protein [Flavobacterium sp.]|nr:phage portal protein [Flavobacterium sp.]MBP6424175.1 phage portal protein [Flavobacterium sp.]